uniref:Obg domain-containing protein n=2 Tax=Brassica TaxID=3705 RepID=A0A0D3AH01_BRAOL
MHVDMEKETDFDEDDEEGQVRYNVAELTEEGQSIIIARGGEGGL